MPENDKSIILLLPGMDGTGALFKPFLRQLPADIDARVISYPEDVYLSYAQLAEHVARQCPQSEPYIMMAESYSGPVAAALLQNAPANLRAVVFVASFVQLPWGKFGAWMASCVPAFLLRLPPPAWLLRWFLMDSSTPDVMVKDVRAVIARVSPPVLAARLRAALRARFSGDLRNNPVRVAYLQPQRDRLLGIKALEGLTSAMPGLEIAGIDGPHFVLQCAPERCVTALMEMGLLKTQFGLEL